MTSGQAVRGILVCGTGIGMTIAANRDPGIRAALCTGGLMARLAREHNDANVLALGSADLIGIGDRTRMRPCPVSVDDLV